MVDSFVLQARCYVTATLLLLLLCDAQQCSLYACVLVCTVLCHMSLMGTSSSSDDDSDTEPPAAKKAKTASPAREDEMAG
jgi:hypothetical protein